VGRLRVFLDANVLFSAALGGDTFALLLELARAGRVELLSSPYCVEEARVNIERKRSDRAPQLLRVLADVTPVQDVHPSSAKSQALLPSKDAPVLDAALAAGADVLVTGDRTHFAHLMSRDDLDLRVRTPRQFLLDGPG
jgi:predicted nucleic acid-binding protein